MVFDHINVSTAFTRLVPRKLIFPCIIIPGKRRNQSYEEQSLEDYILKRVRADNNIIQQGGQLQRNESDPPRSYNSIVATEITF